MPRCCNISNGHDSSKSAWMSAQLIYNSHEAMIHPQWCTCRQHRVVCCKVVQQHIANHYALLIGARLRSAAAPTYIRQLVCANQQAETRLQNMFL